MNAAGKVWTLYPTSDCAVMGLEVGKDCPYYDWPSAGYYRSAMYNENGIFGPGGEFYTFIGKLLILDYLARSTLNVKP